MHLWGRSPNMHTAITLELELLAICTACCLDCPMLLLFLHSLPLVLLISSLSTLLLAVWQEMLMWHGLTYASSMLSCVAHTSSGNGKIVKLIYRRAAVGDSIQTCDMLSRLKVRNRKKLEKRMVGGSVSSWHCTQFRASLEIFESEYSREIAGEYCAVLYSSVEMPGKAVEFCVAAYDVCTALYIYL